jgi:hypothetical protein
MSWRDEMDSQRRRLTAEAMTRPTMAVIGSSPLLPLPSIVWADRRRLGPRNDPGVQRRRIAQVHRKGGVLTGAGMLD